MSEPEPQPSNFGKLSMMVLSGIVRGPIARVVFAVFLPVRLEILSQRIRRQLGFKEEGA